MIDCFSEKPLPKILLFDWSRDYNDVLSHGANENPSHPHVNINTKYKILFYYTTENIKYRGIERGAPSKEVTKTKIHAHTPTNTYYSYK